MKKKKMNISLSKKTILYFLIFFWLVFSTGYMVWSVWNNFKNMQMFTAYEQGRADTINALILETEKCEPVSIFGTEKQIQIISIDCFEGTIGD